MKSIRKKHPLAIRWAHWINFPVLTIMIWSGLLIYWANDVYTITLFGRTILALFPGFHLTSILIFHTGLRKVWPFISYLCGFLQSMVFYTFYILPSQVEWRQLLPNRHSFKEAWLVLLHDLHIRKFQPPQDKYNAAQRIAYTSIIVMGFGSLITGLAIYKPVQFYRLTWLCGGYHLARIEHFILTIGYVLFFIIHIVQVIIAGWNNFRSVISGFEIITPEPSANH